MRTRKMLYFAGLLLAPTIILYADPVPPFGAASAYNLVALGTVDSDGNTVIAGNITNNSDVTGRIAAANTIR